MTRFLRTNLAIGQSSRSCTKMSSYPIGSRLSLFSLYGQRFPRYGLIFKIAIFRHETWQLAKVPEVGHIMYCYPIGWKLGLFSLYGQRFPRYGPIFKKLPYMGMKVGHWIKFVKLHKCSFYPRGSTFELIFDGQQFPRYRPLFKIAIFGH